MNQFEYTTLTTGYHPCAAIGCFEVFVGVPGELCWSCEETGCESGEHCECESE